MGEVLTPKLELRNPKMPLYEATILETSSQSKVTWRAMFLK